MEAVSGLYTVLLGSSGQVPAFADPADPLAGTSTGGILALGLAKGIALKDLIVLYQQQWQRYFILGRVVGKPETRNGLLGSERRGSVGLSAIQRELMLK